MITIPDIDTIGDTLPSAELSNGRDLVAGILNPGTPHATVTVFNARGKRATIGNPQPGTDMIAALHAAVDTLNGH